MTPTESRADSGTAWVAFPRQYSFLKRLLDVTLCLALLPVALVLLAVISVAIWLESPGPPVFLQVRIGLHGRPFRLYKFRTMTHGYDDREARQFMKAYVRGEVGGRVSDGAAAVYKPNLDQHLTRVGRFLRKTSLDELPQVLNVLKGDMSLVGPRPHVAWEVEEYRPWHRRRLDVLPGITGLAQVRGRSGISFDRMVRYDLQYVDERSPMLDMKILWRTLRAVARGQGAA